MDKRVLLPTDYSKNALDAIRYAQKLFKDIKCDFYVLNAYNASGYDIESMMVPEPGEHFYETAKKQSEENMERLITTLEEEHINPNHRFHTICVFNDLVEAVKNQIAKKDIDIIVMGTKGITSSRSRIFGTRTVKVMEQVRNCPVVVVPEHHTFNPPKEIIFPTDYKTNYKKKEIRHLLEIAKLHNSKINVVHIDKDKDGKLSRKELTNQQLLQDILDGTDYETHFLSSVKIAAGIKLFVESRNCDMIAFLNRKHLFFGSILSNPLVKEIGYDPQVPILELNDYT